ncbi:hypothetical protein ACFOKF_08580 [Sphingobium rhizovicinum]|uniref:Uncharacterized protein n=1 Tax=Sphingobium rhizovicinum TaxID=432308 RepID=A0ABV7NGK2_9SPHN
MQQFLQAVRDAIAHKNRYGALAMALTLPDVCGNLDIPGRANGVRYKDWTQKWLAPKYVINGTIFLEESDIYQFRCAMLHEGTANIPSKKKVTVEEIVFSDGPHVNLIVGNYIDGRKIPDTLQLDPLIFAQEVCESVESWLSSVEGNPDIQQRISQLLNIRPSNDSGVWEIRFY